MYLAIGMFVVLDVFLVIWAIDSVRATGELEAAPPPSVALAPQPSAEAEDPASGVAPPTEAAAPTRLIAALDGEIAWRITTGPCPRIASPELSVDGGATWQPTNTSTLTVAGVQHIEVLSPDIATFLGFNAADCSPEGVRTFVAGADFAPFPPLVDDGWLIDPLLPTSVSTPAGAKAAPCALPVAVAPRSSIDAAVLCADQAVYVTDDSGDTWVGGESLPGVVGFAESQSGYISVTAGAADCAGVQVTTLDESLIPSLAGCLSLDQPTTASPGDVAVAEAGGTIWIWVGDSVWRSQDGGTTWQ